MAEGPEAKTTRRIRERLATVDRAWYFKVRGGPMQSVGVPDILWTCEANGGRLVGIEVKAGGNTPTKKQEIMMQRMRLAGVAVIVVWSVDEAASGLRKIGVPL